MSGYCDGRLVLVTASTWEPVTRSEMKDWLKIEDSETQDDALIEALIKTARARYQEWTQRALPREIFDFYPNQVPSLSIELPRSPLVSIGSIKGFTDTDATDTGGTSMNTSEFYTDIASEPGRVVAFGGFTFPTATRIVNPVIVRFTAGYTSSSGSGGVPEMAKTKLKQMVARAYEFRGDQSQAEQDALMYEVVADELALPEWG